MRITGAHGLKGWISGAALALLLSAATTTMASAALPAEDSEAWELREEADGIQVHTMEQNDSNFQVFKAEAVLDAPIEAVVAVIADPTSCVDWVLNCSESYRVGDGDFHDRYVYSVNKMPWPVTDRDYILRIHTRGNEASGKIVIKMSAAPDQRKHNSNRVRVNRSDTLYRLTPDGDKTRMLWLQHTDPNGNLPGWLVNSLLVDIPMSSIEKLEQLASQKHYQNFILVHDDDGKLINVERSYD